MSDLIVVEKAGEQIAVHPATLEAHQRLGWSVSADQKPTSKPATLDNPKGEPVEIPADWESLHWKKQVELALAIVGGDGPLVPAKDQTVAQKAKAIIEAEVAERAK